jgi:hypothetical protein
MNATSSRLPPPSKLSRQPPSIEAPSFKEFRGRVGNADFIVIPVQDVAQTNDPLYKHVVATYSNGTNTTAGI